MFLYFSGSRFKIARGKTFDTIMASNGTLVEICNYANSSKNAFFFGIAVFIGSSFSLLR